MSRGINNNRKLYNSCICYLETITLFDKHTSEVTTLQVFEISIRVRLKQEIHSDYALEAIGTLLDTLLCKSGFEKLHEENQYKNYCFNSFYPIENSKVYQKGKSYTFQVRTIDSELAGIFSGCIVQRGNKELTILTTQIKIIPKHFIEKIYSITPCIMKNETGYWRKSGDLELFERRLKENLIKKYNAITGEKMNEDFQLYTALNFKNKAPVSCAYKNIHLLGDKLELYPGDSKEAQELVYMALGTGILETNARGYGFMNYQWL